MMDLGPHAAFIWTAYGLVTLVLAGLIAWLILDGREQERRSEGLRRARHQAPLRAHAR